MTYKFYSTLATLWLIAVCQIGLIRAQTDFPGIPSNYNVSAEFFDYARDKACSDGIPLNSPFVFNATFILIGEGDYPFPAVPPSSFLHWAFDVTTKHQRWMLGTERLLDHT